MPTGVTNEPSAATTASLILPYRDRNYWLQEQTWR